MMSDYTELDLEVCGQCKCKLTESTPFTLCYDPYHKNNVWGGDSHETVAYLCVQCAQALIDSWNNTSL